MVETMRIYNQYVFGRLLLLVGVLLLTLPAAAQKYPERREVRRGNRSFEREQYDGSIERYRRALTLADSCWEATYNLGNALYKREMRLLEREASAAQPSPMLPQQPGMGMSGEEAQKEVAARFDEAVQLLSLAAADTLRTREERAEAYYNLGGVQFAQQKLQESLQSLRQSLKLNPGDEDAKFNYTFVKRLLENQQDQQQQGGGEQNQQQNQQDQQQQNQDQQQQDQPQNPEEQNSEPQPENQEPQEQPQQPQPGEISPQEQAQMLDAIQAQEDETQEKLKERRGVVVRSAKNW